MTDEKILDRLAKIKTHAESARKIGSIEEAEAFASMLQRLLTRYKLAMSDIEFEQHERDEPVGQYPVDWEDVAVRRTRVQWIERLAYIVTKAHFCRYLVHNRSSKITIVGRESDAKVAEYLLVVLVRAVERLSHAAAYRSNTTREERGYGYRTAYIGGFVGRLAERFDEERRAPENTTSTALVRINRATVAVTAYMKEHTRPASQLGGRQAYNSTAREDGRRDADAVGLRANAVDSGADRTRGAIGGS